MGMVSVIVFITLALLLISHSPKSSSRLRLKILNSFSFTDPPHHESASFEPLGVILPSTSYKPKKQLRVPFFIFGDSLFDPGNNNYINNSKTNQASFCPYGETYFKHPTGRFSNGRLIPDFIAQLAGMPLIPPFLQPGLHEYHYGVNFASSGSGALDDTNLAIDKTINLHTQLRNYKKVETWFRGEVGNVEAQKRLSHAVHFFNAGLCDYKSIISTNTSSNYVEMVIGNLTTIVKEVYKSGGRKFVFLTLMDLGYMPQFRLSTSQGKGRQVEAAASLQKQHNKKLRKLCVELEQNLDDFMYMIYDFNQSTEIKLQSPSKYGIKEEKVACCGSGKFRGIFSCGLISKFEVCENPDEYMFFDSVHPTEKVYEQVAYEMWRGGTHQIGPYNVKQLFQLV